MIVIGIEIIRRILAGQSFFEGFYLIKKARSFLYIFANSLS